jgi:hypothetical protein
MDDNHRLVEWIAYHYFVMKLRYLVILPDPKSRFSPKPVLDRWRDKIEIVEWTDRDYMEAGKFNKSVEFARSNVTDPQVFLKHYLMRQSTFYQKCAGHMQRHNGTWVSFHDVDEFYNLNSDIVVNATQRMREPNSVWNFLIGIQSLLQSMKDFTNIEVSEHYQGPCVSTYRTSYGSVESLEKESSRDVPSFLDARRFQTLRWRHHDVHTRAIIGKSLIDVSSLPNVEARGWGDEDKPFRPHKVIPMCPNPRYHDKAFFRVNHYVGNWEYYSFRKNDGRQGGVKNHKKWQRESTVQGGTSGDDIRPWIGGFVDYFGETKAAWLLEGIGLDPNYTATVEKSWLSGKKKRR